MQEQGEHGKSFGVVANEIKKLSDDCKKSANHTKEIVEQNYDELKLLIKNINSNKESVEDGTETVESTIKSFNTLSNTMRNSIDKTMELIKEIELSNKNVNEVNEFTVNSADVISELSTEILNISALTEEQLATQQEILASSEDIVRETETLKETSSNFKIK